MAHQTRSDILGKEALGSADTADHAGLLDANLAKHGVGPAALSGQVDTAARIAAPSLWVVARKAAKPAFVLMRMRLSLIQLRAQIAVLSLQRLDPVSQKAQSLAQDRRRAVFVDQRLKMLQKALGQFILRGVVQSTHRTEGGAA